MRDICALEVRGQDVHVQPKGGIGFLEEVALALGLRG